MAEIANGDKRKELLNILTKADEIIAEISSRQNTISENENKLEKAKEEANITANGGFYLVVLLIIVAIAWFISRSVIGVIIGIVIGLIVVGMITTPKDKQKKEEYNSIIIPNLEKEIEESKKKLDMYMCSSEVKKISEFIPKKYLTLDAINAIKLCIEENISDSIEDAIALYEDALKEKRRKQEAAAAAAREAAAREAEARARAEQVAMEKEDLNWQLLSDKFLGTWRGKKSGGTVVYEFIVGDCESDEKTALFEIRPDIGEEADNPNVKRRIRGK